VILIYLSVSRDDQQDQTHQNHKNLFDPHPNLVLTNSGKITKADQQKPDVNARISSNIAKLAPFKRNELQNQLFPS
jgi:hypothetical protein